MKRGGRGFVMFQYCSKETGQAFPWVNCGFLPCFETDLPFSKGPALALRLQLHHVGIKPILRIERVRRALLGNYTVGKNNDLIRARDSAHAVCDDEHGLIPDKP